MDNVSLQADEVEALSSIYEQEWKTVSESSRIFSISLNSCQREIILEVTLPVEYPLEAPPQYQLIAPWLRGDVRRQLSCHLDTLYWDNVGSSILYIWIERIREFLEDLSDKDVTLEEEAVPEPSGLVDLQPPLHAAPCPQITHGECIVDRKSVFQGHAAAVTSVPQFQQVLAELKKNRKIASAAHNMWAYRMVGSNSASFVQDCDDDGETHAGSRMLHLLEIVGAENVAVVVTRWYGGILLGPDRFRHINNATRQVLQASGAIQAREHNKKSKR